MANPTPEVSLEDLINKIGTSEITQRAITITNSRLAMSTRARSEVDVLDDGYIDVDTIDSLLVTHLNGVEGLPEQRVTVEYLRGSQRMVVPAILAMHWDENGESWSGTNTTLIDRYHKIATLSYQDLKTLMTTAKTLTATATAIDALPKPARTGDGRVQYTHWWADAYYANTRGQMPPLTEIITTFTFISTAAQMNADVRDFGMLLLPQMTKGDSDWKDVSGVTEISVLLKAYTLQSIAAMNYAQVNNYPLGAWVRAYGIGVGIMPHRTSKTVIEYAFTTRMPTKEQRVAVAVWHRDYPRNASEICCNILAMFGLFHLNKDHTHRSQDAAMQRIQKSYIGAIRTATTDETNESMQSKPEEVARTAPHPFGLAQTYWLALAMGKLEKLAAPLALRVNTCPPPVQRLLMVNAMLKEWASLPAGQILNKAFAEEFSTIVREVDIVRETPPKYSGLYRLYGLDKMEVLKPAAIEAVNALIPPIYGYVMLTHVTANQERSGPALALSWGNITRDHNAVLDGWRSLWSRYFEGMETQDMVKFALSTKAAAIEYRRALEESREGRE